MNNELSYFLALPKSSESTFALISLSKESILFYLFENKLKNIEVELKKEINFLISPILKNKSELIKIDYIRNKKDLDLWITIQNGTFIPYNDFTRFLCNHNLLKKWLSGKLKGVVAYNYRETSKAFGVRGKHSEDKVNFNDDESIWKIEKYFDGIVTERDGDYSKFYYKQEMKLIELNGISCNEDWNRYVKSRI